MRHAVCNFWKKYKRYFLIQRNYIAIYLYYQNVQYWPSKQMKHLKRMNVLFYYFYVLHPEYSIIQVLSFVIKIHNQLIVKQFAIFSQRSICNFPIRYTQIVAKLLFRTIKWLFYTFLYLYTEKVRESVYKSN